MGVSLWHKIFGSPDQQAERIAEITSVEETSLEIEREIPHQEHYRGDRPRDDRPRDDDRGRRGRRREEAVPERGADDDSERDSRSDEAAAAPFADTTEAGDSTDEPTDENGEPRKRRRRRGRGRGRGRRPEGEAAAGEQPAERTEARSAGTRELRESREPREQREPREGRDSRGRSRSSRPRREEVRHAAPKDDFDDDGLEEIILDDVESDEFDDRLLDGDADDAEDGTGRTTPAGHKSIPSWDEAIGMIVDTNLATRTDRRRSSAPQSRGQGSSRGRSRGGRRRKSS